MTDAPIECANARIPMPAPAPTVAQLGGLWRRSLIAWPDGTRDTDTEVRWLQGQRIYLDLRRPTAAPDFSHAQGLESLSQEDCAWLARQEGFAGHLSFDGSHFTWARSIDFQPPALHADAGALWWERDVLVERGRDIDYVEHWHRDETQPVQPAAAVLLRERTLGIQGALLRVGTHFMLARERAAPAPAGRLSDCVAGAPSLHDSRRLVDCELSFGTVSPRGFLITASSLPYRVGDVLAQRWSGDSLTTQDRTPTGGAMMRYWLIEEGEGELGALREPGPA